MSARYDFGVRDDVDCLVTSVVAENPALRVIGESQGFDAVMQTILVAGCLYLRSREGITPDPDAPVWEIAKAARLLGMHLEGYGCAGTSATAYGLACLELEAGDSGIRSLVSVQGSLAMYAIHAFGSEEHKQEWLPRMAAGEAMVRGNCRGDDGDMLYQLAVEGVGIVRLTRLTVARSCCTNCTTETPWMPRARPWNRTSRRWVRWPVVVWRQ